jgi:ectoine hydroxylase-related dioxygenase (phytanoyl-CoA dioxygenase family)
VELEAGGVLFFNFGVAHCTGPNRTDRERAGLATHYLRTDHVPEGRNAAAKATPHLSGPLASGGMKEYGEDLRGVWESLVKGSAES